MRFAGRKLAFLLASILLAVPACRKIVKRHSQPKLQKFVAPPQQLVPLGASKAFDKLPLDHFEPATVFIPVGARWPRPIVIAIHGRSDSQDTDCQAWSLITQHDYFVLCPSLRASHPGDADAAPAECSTTDCLADEMRAALLALRRRFGRYVARGEVVLAGFDDGAGRAVPIALQNPAVFPVVWLVNGGLKEWLTALSSTFVERGGKWLGLVCSDASCEADSLRVTASANAAGLKTALAKPGQVGISWDPRVLDAARQVWIKSKPVGWPWSAPRKSEHTSSPP